MMKDKVKELMLLLSQEPRTQFLQIKKLKGHKDLYRIRVNDYRIVYEVFDQRLIIVVIKLGHRKDTYKSI